MTEKWVSEWYTFETQYTFETHLPRHTVKKTFIIVAILPFPLTIKLFSQLAHRNSQPSHLDESLINFLPVWLTSPLQPYDPARDSWRQWCIPFRGLSENIFLSLRCLPIPAPFGSPVFPSSRPRGVRFSPMRGLAELGVSLVLGVRAWCPDLGGSEEGFREKTDLAGRESAVGMRWMVLLIVLIRWSLL